jgi:leucyl-tRNA synthetase
LYIGGIDNAVMHLLYTRFWSKVARDMGLVFFDEPIKSLLTQGMVLGEVKSCLKPNSWSAMSKTLGNGVDPDQIIEKYGVDPVRLFVLFAAPPEQELRWSEKGIEGTIRFLHKVRDLIDAWAVIFTEVSENSLEKNTKTAKKIRYLTHKSIAKITYDMERFHFNTCISTLMEFVNGLCEIDIMIVREDISVKFAIKEALEALITMLTPFAPHFAEEMWHTLGNKKNILSSCVEWPKYETKLIENQVINLAVQINGKLCTRISTDVNYSREEIEALVLADKKVIARVKSKNITRIVFVPNHLINLVLS